MSADEHAVKDHYGRSPLQACRHPSPHLGRHAWPHACMMVCLATMQHWSSRCAIARRRALAARAPGPAVLSLEPWTWPRSRRPAAKADGTSIPMTTTLRIRSATRSLAHYAGSGEQPPPPATSPHRTSRPTRPRAGPVVPGAGTTRPRPEQDARPSPLSAVVCSWDASERQRAFGLGRRRGRGVLMLTQPRRRPLAERGQLRTGRGSDGNAPLAHVSVGNY